MNGPDHYREAERLLTEMSLTDSSGEYRGGLTRQDAAALAHVHATLALAAATALGTSPAEGRAWADVAGTRLGDS